MEWALSVAEKSTVILGLAGLLVAGLAQLVHVMTVGASPSLVQAFMMVAAAVPIFGLALLGIMPILPALLLLLPPLVLGFVMLSKALTEMLSDQFVTNLQLMAMEIGNMVDKINELDTVKTVAFTAATVATGVSGAALAAVGLSAPSPTPVAAAGGGGGGEGPTINVNLSIDGTEFTTAVNKVEVSKYSGGEPSDMYSTIVDMIASGITKGA